LRKIFKISIVAFLALIIFAVAGLSIVFLDVASYTASGSQTLNPSGSSVGRALVVYDPGLTGAAKNVASKIASDIQARGYTVDFAGVKSGVATNDTSQYQVIVVGGPIYGGKPASSIQAYITSLNPGDVAKLGIFGVGSYNTPGDQLYPSPEGSTLTVTYALKINTSEDATARSSFFVNQLLH
jgi:flavodoxin